MQDSAKAVAEVVDESAPVHEEVNKQKKPIDEEPAKDLSVLVGIGREIIMLKCIVGLVFCAI